jgi:hypothetical protein
MGMCIAKFSHGEENRAFSGETQGEMTVSNHHRHRRSGEARKCLRQKYKTNMDKQDEQDEKAVLLEPGRNG